MSIKNNIAAVQEKIAQACAKSGRSLADIKIIAVTKNVDIPTADSLIDLGFKEIGENRVQDGLLKYSALSSKATWHFIGNLQTRKVKEIIGKFSYIHSLDRLSLASELNKRAKLLDTVVKCFVQVNVSGEDTKSGVEPENLLAFISELSSFSAIEIVGLMTMAPFEVDSELTRPVFKRLRELLALVNQAQILPYRISELSMGMSNDYEIAIEEGATYIRLGTALTKEAM